MNTQKDDDKVADNIAHFAMDLLDDNAQHLSAVTLRRLAEARHLAVNQLTFQQAEMANGVSQSGNVLKWLGGGFGSYFDQHRWLSATVAMGVMAITFFVTQQINIDDNLESGDAFLLASELPPEAFADKGFDTWLVSKQD